LIGPTKDLAQRRFVSGPFSFVDVKQLRGSLNVVQQQSVGLGSWGLGNTSLKALFSILKAGLKGGLKQLAKKRAGPDFCLPENPERAGYLA
jgi:hypothetical protein